MPPRWTRTGHRPADPKASAAAAAPVRSRRGASGGWGTVVGWSAAGLCLVCLLAACGSGGGGYTAVGPAGGPTGRAARPTGTVTLVPLDGPHGTADRSAGSASGPAGGSPAPVDGAASGTGPSSAAGGQDGATGSGDPAGGPDGAGNSADGPAGSVPAPSASPSGAASTRPRPSGSAVPGTPAPAALTWSAPTREATDKRWCEKVTVTFRNSGGTAVRSGTITLGTHIIDLLGIDWATVGSAQRLPVPIAPHSRTDGTWTVCVDAWRVPLGMHVETRIAGVDWS